MAEPQPYPCPSCIGDTGGQPDPSCQVCDGIGECIPCTTCSGDDPSCPECDGEGNVPNQAGGGGTGGGGIEP